MTVSRETRDRLDIFAECLKRWNGTINLVSFRDDADLWARHIDHGIAVGCCLEEWPGDVADLGSGAGIPGLVAAITSGRHISLIESDRRKCAFLIEAARLTHANVTVVPARVEQAALTSLAVVMARALAPLDRLLALAAPLLRPDGVCLLLKGSAVQDELAAAERVFSFSHRTLSPGLLCISDVRSLA